MLTSDHPPITRLTAFDKIFASIASADIETLARCKRLDVNTVNAIAVLMILTCIYQTVLFSAIGHRFFGLPDHFDPLIVAASAFLAIFLQQIDSFTIVRSDFFQSGIAAITRSGLDISGGITDHVKSASRLAIRIFLALGLSQFTAIGVCDLMFSPDTKDRIEHNNRNANAALVAAETERKDADIGRQRGAISAKIAEISTFTSEAQSLRKREDDLMSSEPGLEEAKAEITRLIATKSTIDDELQDAQTFAINESAGIKGTPNNTGLVGEGTRYHAAVERVANAKARVAENATALEAARGRLGFLTKQFTARVDGARGQIDAQLASVQKSVATDRAELAVLTGKLNELVLGRDAAIQSAVRESPDYVPMRTGLLIEIEALREIANDNPEVAIVILLVEITSFGFELAAVLAKVLAFVPTTYSTLLARDSYMSDVAIVEEMDNELRRQTGAHERMPEPQPDLEAANDNMPERESDEQAALNPASDEPTPPPQPPKRPRGRPRKVPAE